MSFNHFKIKREAHALSRQSTDARFSPFAHFAWGRPRPNQQAEGPRRASTFPNDIEAQRDDGVYDSPVTHSQTAPQAGAFRPDGTGPASLAFEDSNGSALEKNTEQASGESYVDSNPSTAEGTLLKNRTSRKKEAEPNVSQDPEDAAKEKKPHRLFKTVHPKHPFTVANQLQRTFLNSWINILLVAAPVGIALHFTPVNPIAVFVVNFIAIVPLAAMLSFATEEIALRTGETLGGLLNATFGNAVELIVAVMALTQGQVVIVQTSLIGSILSNLLLVMGMCFFFGGLQRQEQFFNTTVAQTAASLLALAVAGVIVPTVFDAASITPPADVASLSRGTAIILLVVYAAYLFFQLKTHHGLFSEESKKVPAKPFKLTLQKGAVNRALLNPAAMMGGGVDEQNMSRVLNTGEEEEEEEEPQLHFFVAIGVLTGSTVLIAFCAEFLVDSIDYVTSTGHISKEFLGLILLPIVGNAAEHATAVTVAIKDKMDLAIGVAVGSSMQVALFLIPLLVVIGWGMNLDDMSLSFDIFQVAVLFVSVLLVNYLIADGKSHWLEGMLLMCLYAIIAVCSWWYPTGSEDVV